jgi:hypothetical protein
MAPTRQTVVDPSALAVSGLLQNHQEHSFCGICTPRAVLIPSWKLANASAAQPAAISGLRFVNRSASIIVLTAQAPLKSAQVAAVSPVDRERWANVAARISNRSTVKSLGYQIAYKL